MSKQEYADKWSLNQWKFLCQNDDFCQAFWMDFYEECDLIAADLLGA